MKRCAGKFAQVKKTHSTPTPLKPVLVSCCVLLARELVIATSESQLGLVQNHETHANTAFSLKAHEITECSSAVGGQE